MLGSIVGFFKSNNDLPKASGWVPPELPAESYQQSIEIPELWVRILLEVDALTYAEELKKEREETTNKKNKKNKEKIMKKKTKKSEPHAVVRLSYVCRAWRDLSRSNDVWKVLSQKRWKTVRIKAKVRNWMKFYSRRYLIEKGMAPLKAHEISNCNSLEFEFECPMVLEELRSSRLQKQSERFCEKCKETVYVCSNEEEVIRHVAQQHCIAVDKVFVYTYHECHSRS